MSSKHRIHYSRYEYRNEYLRSPEWRAKSSAILTRDKICRICEMSPSTDAHHLTYDRISFENLDTDLIGVCRKCHNTIHRHEELQVKFPRGAHRDLYRDSAWVVSKVKFLFNLSRKPYPVSPAMIAAATDCLSAKKLRKAALVLGVNAAAVSGYVATRKHLNIFTATRLFCALSGRQLTSDIFSKLSTGTLSFENLSPKEERVAVEKSKLFRSKSIQRIRKDLDFGDARQPSTIAGRPRKVLQLAGHGNLEKKKSVRFSAKKRDRIQTCVAFKKFNRAKRHSGKVCAHY